ncbi:DUF4397 domain-containing protein [bacterium]|nr:DUF4397 domain-containing protein [bacterium]
MKTIFELLRISVVAAVMLPLAMPAQDAPKNGFIRLVNALAVGTGTLTMEIDGKKLSETGYKIGDVSGGISLPPGNRTVVFSRTGVTGGTTRVNVSANETTTLIPFAEKVAATDQVPAHWEIRILRLKQQDPEEERSATFASVSQNPEVKVEMREPDGKWIPIYVKRLAVAQAPIHYPRGYVPLRSAGNEIESIPVASAGNYVVLLYDDAEGKLQSLSFRDKKFLSAD